jgi:hypothetical protein
MFFRLRFQNVANTARAGIMDAIAHRAAFLAISAGMLGMIYALTSERRESGALPCVCGSADVDE